MAHIGITCSRCGHNEWHWAAGGYYDCAGCGNHLSHLQYGVLSNTGDLVTERGPRAYDFGGWATRPDNYVSTSCCPVCFLERGSLVISSSFHQFDTNVIERMCPHLHRWRVDHSTQPPNITILEDDMTDTTTPTDVVDECNPPPYWIAPAPDDPNSSIRVIGWDEHVKVQDQLALVVAERDRALQRNQDLAEAVAERGTDVLNLKANIGYIGERLLAEAQQRDWCDVFDNVVKEINESCFDVGDGSKLLTRDFSGTIEVTLRVDVSAEGPVSSVLGLVDRVLYGQLDNARMFLEDEDDDGVKIQSFIVTRANSAEVS